MLFGRPTGGTTCSLSFGLLEEERELVMHDEYLREENLHQERIDESPRNRRADLHSHLRREERSCWLWRSGLEGVDGVLGEWEVWRLLRDGDVTSGEDICLVRGRNQ